MTKKALIVIDMLNEYLTPDGLVYCAECREIIPNIKKCIDFSHNNNILVVYVNTSLSGPEDTMVKKWGLHAVEGTYGAEVVEDLKPSTNDLIIKKKGYNAFHETELHEKLQEFGVTELILTGIHTHVCVLLTGVGAFEYGYNVITLEDCITTGYLPNHETRLRFFKTHIGALIGSEEWTQQVAK